MQSVSDVDWPCWRPTEEAVLLFVIQKGQALLIHKKRGLGAGKINAPGGRLEPGETPEEAAVRETREEVGVTVIAPRRRGRLRFQFVDGYALDCHVLSCDRCEGEPYETDEAVPMWTPLDAFPFDRMWADDRLWIPLMFAGRRFSGRFIFDGDRIVDHVLEDEDPARPLFEKLRELDIAIEVATHPPVFTVEQAKLHRPAGELGACVKNLFVRNKKGDAWLVTTLEDRAIDMKTLGRRLGAGTLSFASFDRLRQQLGVEPGSVTPLSVFNDPIGSVRMVLDAAILRSGTVHVHPLTNDRTITLSTKDLLRFLEATGHPPLVLDLDAEA